jgi:hypothetical protein
VSVRQTHDTRVLSVPAAFAAPIDTAAKIASGTVMIDFTIAL